MLKPQVQNLHSAYISPAGTVWEVIFHCIRYVSFEFRAILSLRCSIETKRETIFFNPLVFVSIDNSDTMKQVAHRKRFGKN